MRGRRLRRVCVLAAAALLAGAVVNVLVAWGCAIWVGTPPDYATVAAAVPWRGEVPGDWPVAQQVADDLRSWCGSFQIRAATSVPPNAPDGPADAVWMEYSYRIGWPAPAMAGFGLSWWVGDGPKHSEKHWIKRLPSWVPRNDKSWVNSGREIPLRPVFPQFALGAVFYSGPFAFVFLGVWAIRRRSRSRAGHCPACAYDLVGLSVGAACPECGAVSATRSSLALRAR